MWSFCLSLEIPDKPSGVVCVYLPNMSSEVIPLQGLTESIKKNGVAIDGFGAFAFCLAGKLKALGKILQIGDIALDFDFLENQVDIV